MEKWKTISGFPSYEISTHGRIRSYKTYQGTTSTKYHMVSPCLRMNGYFVATLYDCDHIPHQILLHRLVATAFIPNPHRYPYVDHIDGNKKNNSVKNLEWVSPKINSIRAVRTGLCDSVFEKTRKPVIITDLRTGEESYFNGLNEAAKEIGYSPAGLSRVANGIIERIGFYSVDFADEENRLLYNYPEL